MAKIVAMQGWFRAWGFEDLSQGNPDSQHLFHGICRRLPSKLLVTLNKLPCLEGQVELVSRPIMGSLGLL